MPHRSHRLILAGRVVFGVLVVGLVVYLVVVGLDKADKIASSVSAVLAAIALLGPYLVPASKQTGATVEGSGSATAVGGGQANTGVQGRAASAHVRRSGDARAEGPGSIANTGVRDES